MIHGIYLDHRIWEMDIATANFWNPNAYGVQIDPPKMKQTRIGRYKLPIDKKYKFAITTSVWEKPIRITLQYLRNLGLKIFLLPREPFKYDALKPAMFSHPDYLVNGEYFFKPDAVLAPGQDYANLWKDITKTYVTGYPRFEQYIIGKISDRIKVAKTYGLNENKKWILFPDYPPVFSQYKDGKKVDVGLEQARDETLFALERFAKANNSFQVIVKMHPQTWKSYVKYNIYVSDLLKEMIDNPREEVRVIEDSWYSSTKVAKELLEHSDIVVGYTSTMILEAAILKKSLVHVLFGNSGKLKGLPVYSKFMPTAYTESELMHILSDKIESNPDGLIRHYLCEPDGQSCRRTCEAIVG